MNVPKQCIENCDTAFLPEQDLIALIVGAIALAIVLFIILCIICAVCIKKKKRAEKRSFIMVKMFVFSCKKCFFGKNVFMVKMFFFHGKKNFFVLKSMCSVCQGLCPSYSKMSIQYYVKKAAWVGAFA
jgi:hypothetical protein